ncbi:MAG: hypothetical protein PHH14_05770 [Candidatus Margulisbacteria bacterium]|nr:hypothetical protein [Candidatus Margulisiibacteriota bacterium]
MAIKINNKAIDPTTTFLQFAIKTTEKDPSLYLRRKTTHNLSVYTAKKVGKDKETGRLDWKRLEEKARFNIIPDAVEKEIDIASLASKRIVCIDPTGGDPHFMANLVTVINMAKEAQGMTGRKITMLHIVPDHLGMKDGAIGIDDKAKQNVREEEASGMADALGVNYISLGLGFPFVDPWIEWQEGKEGEYLDHFKTVLDSPTPADAGCLAREIKRCSPEVIFMPHYFQPHRIRSDSTWLALYALAGMPLYEGKIELYFYEIWDLFNHFGIQPNRYISVPSEADQRHARFKEYLPYQQMRTGKHNVLLEKIKEINASDKSPTALKLHKKYGQETCLERFMAFSLQVEFRGQVEFSGTEDVVLDAFAIESLINK